MQRSTINYDRIKMAAFTDELAFIMEKEASIRMLKGAITGARKGLGKALTGLGKKVTPQIAGATRVAKGPPRLPSWSMGQKSLARTPVSELRATAKGAVPKRVNGLRPELMHRAAETTPQIAASKQKLIQTLQQRGIKVPKELTTGARTPIARGLGTPRLVSPRAGPTMAGIRPGSLAGKGPAGTQIVQLGA